MEKVFYYLSDKNEQLIMDHPEIIWSSFQGNHLQQFEIEDKKAIIDVSAMVCYSEKNLYALVKTNQDMLTKNNRAYQNGDGFHFVIALPQTQDKPSGDFYVIAVSPMAESSMKSMIWYRNIEFIGSGLKNSSTSHRAINDSVYFVTRVSWDEIYPFKPYINKEYGFNISYVHALPDRKGKNIYMLKKDEYIQSEQHLREYEIFGFQEPEPGNEISAIIDCDKLNAEKGEAVTIKIGVNNPQEAKAFLKIINNNKKIIEKDMLLKTGLYESEIQIDADKLNPAINNIKVDLKVNDTDIDKKFEIYIYSNDEFNNIRDEVNALEASGSSNPLIKNSIYSLRFYYEDLLNKFKTLKQYESFESIRKYEDIIHEKIMDVKKGSPLFAYGQIVRLGFNADSDNTVQPYSLYIPESIQNKGAKGLMICLHGSGSDDTSVFGNRLYTRLAEETGFIMTAPFARGESHCYCPQESLNDISELTAVLKKIFNITDQPVILQGFSMGGYGVLRVYDYCPDIFDGIAMFSGHPDLPPEFDISGQPDYMKDENIEKFKSADMIIYHGSQDLNCSFEEMNKFINKLKEINKRLQVVISDCGHSGIREEWYESFKKWIMSI